MFLLLHIDIQYGLKISIVSSIFHIPNLLEHCFTKEMVSNIKVRNIAGPGTCARLGHLLPCDLFHIQTDYLQIISRFATTDDRFVLWNRFPSLAICTILGKFTTIFKLNTVKQRSRTFAIP